jgi:two-component system, response regulator
MQDQKADLILVEDNSSDVAVALRAFRRHALAHRVKVLRDGAEAVDYLLASPREMAVTPKVILLDLKMPRMDGRAVLRQLRADERTRHIPIVIVSSSDREGDVRECYELGANSFVVKQFDPSRPGEYMVDTARYWLDTNEVPRAERRDGQCNSPRL